MKIIIPGEPAESTDSNQLLSVDLFRAEWERMEENNKRFQAMFRVAELRKLCGVNGPQTTTICVRKPPRYK